MGTHAVLSRLSSRNVMCPIDNPWMFTEASIRAKTGHAQPASAAALARFRVRDSIRLRGHIHKMTLPVQKYRELCRWARCRNMYTFHVSQPHTTAREL